MTDPFHPKLQPLPIIPYDYKTWCCNYIWLHKQPLFLWLMALYLKIFGVNEFVLRLSSAVMGAVLPLFVYRISFLWTRLREVSMIAAVMAAVNNFSLELGVGVIATDHNDAAFTFFVAASIWSLFEYTKRSNYARSILTGVLIGCAVLVKWLPGMLALGGWFVWITADAATRKDWLRYRHWLTAAVAGLVIFLPWQLYSSIRYPKEAQVEYAGMHDHFFRVLDNQGGTVWYHFLHLDALYGKWVFIFIALGVIISMTAKEIDKKLSLVTLVMCLVFYLFFSLAATKMPAFTFPVCSLMFVYASLGLMYPLRLLKLSEAKHKSVVWTIALVIAIYCLSPWEIRKSHFENTPERQAKIHNTSVYKQLPDSVIRNYVVLNCNAFEDKELMFYRGGNAYQWFPSQCTLDSLIAKGYKFAAFKSHGEYVLPPYIYQDGVLILNYGLE